MAQQSFTSTFDNCSHRYCDGFYPRLLLMRLSHHLRHGCQPSSPCLFRVTPSDGNRNYLEVSGACANANFMALIRGHGGDTSAGRTCENSETFEPRHSPTVFELKTRTVKFASKPCWRLPALKLGQCPKETLGDQQFSIHSLRSFKPVWMCSKMLLLSAFPIWSDPINVIWLRHACFLDWFKQFQDGKSQTLSIIQLEKLSRQSSQFRRNVFVVKGNPHHGTKNSRNLTQPVRFHANIFLTARQPPRPLSHVCDL